MSQLATMTVRLPGEIKQRLEALAHRTSQLSENLAADAISNYVSLQEWQIRRIEAGVRAADIGDFASDEEVNAFFAQWSDAS